METASTPLPPFHMHCLLGVTEIRRNLVRALGNQSSNQVCENQAAQFMSISLIHLEYFLSLNLDSPTLTLLP